MRFKHRKLLISGTAVAAAGALGVGALLQSVLSVQASSEMMPGIETIVNESTAEEPFKILELVDSSSAAEIGYYIAGQEPSLKLYEYQYQDSDGQTQKVHFTSIADALSKLPAKQRTEFVMNVKVNADGSIDENADTGIKKIGDVVGADSSKYPLSYTDYQEKYFLDAGDSEDDWTKVDLVDFDGNSRTDTVQVNGSYQENSAGTGNYSKEEQEYYPIRSDSEEDKQQPEKYRENIENFYASEGSDSRGAYYLEFTDVSNGKVNSSLEADKGQGAILPEYNYGDGRYGYYENVYTDLTKEISDNLDQKNYQFPGENPDAVDDAALLLQDNEQEAVQSTITESNEFGSGENNNAAADVGTQDDIFSEDTIDSSGDVTFDNSYQSDDSEAFDSGEDTIGDSTDMQDVDETDGFSEESYEEPADAAGADNAGDEFSDQETSSDSDTVDFNTDTQDDSDGVPFAGDESDVDSSNADAQAEENQSDSRTPLGGIADEATAGTQSNPYIYLGKTIDAYPYYKYALIGDLKYVETKAAQLAAQIAADPSGARTDGDIILDSDQYWYYEYDSVTEKLNRYPLSVVTGRQPVEFKDIQSIPDDFDYNYYYRVKKVYFCCKTVDNQTENPSACVYQGWYYPNYPQNEEVYIPVTDGDGKVATHYISTAEYSLTPGTGNYDFVPGGDSAVQVQVNSLYYRGGYVNNDWFKKDVFHLSPKTSADDPDGEFETFGIQVDTRLATDITTTPYAVTSGEDIAGQSITVDENTADAVNMDTADSGNAAKVQQADEADAVDFTSEIDEADVGESTEDTEPAVNAEQSDDTVDMVPADGEAGADTDVDVQTTEEDTADAGDAQSDSLEDTLTQYDLIYVNGNLSEEVAQAIVGTDIPCIVNDAQADSDAVQNIFDGFIKDATDDADGHYVNTYMYFFKNMYAVYAGTSGDYNLLNTHFYDNFNADSDSDSTEDVSYDSSSPMQGFEEIIRYINSENRYRQLESDGNTGDDSKETMNPLDKTISQARAIEYIINYKYKRHILTKSSLNVLEITPDDNCSQLTNDNVRSWLGEKESRVESATACCFYDAPGTSEDGRPSNVLDGDSSTIWHSNWANNSNHKLSYGSSDRHYLTLHFRKPEDIKGFIYQARYYKTNDNWNKNGVLSQYTVVCKDKNGNEVYRKEKQSVGAEFTSNETRSIEFGKTVKHVSEMTIYFEQTLGNGQPTYNNASCASLDAIYADDDSSVSVDVKVNSMTASEFVGHIDDIASEYDMIYISDRKNSNNNSLITGSGSLRYTHVGDGRQATTGTTELHKLLGQLDNEYDQTWIGNNGIRRFAPFSTYSSEGGGYFRGSGNDMTSEECEELLDFVKSGYPVVLGGSLLNSDRTVNTNEVDNSSYYYEFLSQAVNYDNVVTRAELDTSQKNMDFYFNLAKPVIQFDEDGGKPKEPIRIGETATDENGYIDGELKYTFTVKNDSDAAPASTTYDCNLYLDLNFDGNLSEKESQDKYMTIQDENGNVLSQKDYGNGDMHYELKIGKKYTVIRKIPADYFKVITWKLELTSNRNSYIHTSEIGYAKQKNKGKPQQINVLQLIPTRYTWDLTQSSNFKKWMSQVEDFNINITTKTVTEINGYTRAQMDTLLSDKQMLVLGFADVYQDISNTNGQVNAILDFVKSGKSIIFSHDTTSYVNYDKDKMYGKIATTAYGVDENTERYYDNWLFNTAKNPTWGLSLNTVLRSVVGMDRYGITSDETIGNQTVSQLLKKGQGLDASSVNFADLMSAAGDIAYKTGSDRSSSYAQTQAYTNHLVSGIKLGDTGNKSKVTVAAKINDGAITQYPFRMGDRISVAETHGQYYQLALEQDKDINGMSDGKTDVVVWYCLRNGIYDYSPNDVRNNYYFYSKGNVIYTGAGHSTVDGDEEIKLFINAMVAAANVTAVEPEVHFVKALNPAAETETSRYYMTDQSSWTSGEANILEKDMTYYINVRDYNMVSTDLNQDDLDKQEMTVQFYIDDANGSKVDGCPSSGNVKDITADIGSLSGYGNIGTIVLGSDGKFHLSQNSAYGLQVSDIEQYLRSQDGSNGYKESCKLYVKVSSTVYLYGQEKTSTVWSSIDLKQRQLFEMD